MTDECRNEELMQQFQPEIQRVQEMPAEPTGRKRSISVSAEISQCQVTEAKGPPELVAPLPGKGEGQFHSLLK